MDTTDEAPERRACRTTEPMYTAADLEAARDAGRAEANTALDWGTTCIGCAGRLKADRATYERGGVDMASLIGAQLRALYGQTGERVLLEAVAVALGHAERASLAGIDGPV